MKYKRFLSFILTIVMLTGMFTVPVEAESEIKVLLDGQELEFDVPPQVINNRTMVPMRKIFEAMGATVEWVGESQRITAVKGDISVIMQIDNNVIQVNGENITLDVPPQAIKGRTLVPARAVAESLNAKVEWDGDARSVIITSDEELTPIVPIDLSVQKDFVCNVGATITYGYDDIWNRTVGTEFIPHITMIDSAYRGQTVLISPLYANFAINDDGYAKVTYSFKRRNPAGEEIYLAKDVVAIDGICAPNQIIKAIDNLEYVLDDSDELGVYTFTVESKDVIGNKTTKNIFRVKYSEYEYVRNEFTSIEELTGFVENYGKNPNPDRIIDAIVYAEKQGIITYPILFTGFVEMLAKNAYIAPKAIEVFEKEFGVGGTETLVLVENTAANYLEILYKSNPPTITKVVTAEEINGNIMMYGSAVGAYFSAASYDAAKVLVKSMEKSRFSQADMKEYGVPDLKNLIHNDPLFNAYCAYMLKYESSLNSNVKEILSKILGE